MPPFSFARSAPEKTCSWPKARNFAIQARKSWRSLMVFCFAGRVLTAVSMPAVYRSMPRRVETGRGLHVEDQPLGLAAAAADHDLFVGGLLFLAEHRIVMHRDAGDHFGLASAANAELAGIIDVDAGVEQHFEHFLARRDEIFLPRLGELDPEATEAVFRVRIFLRRKIFDVNVYLRPARRCRLEGFEHRIGGAAVKMRP